FLLRAMAGRPILFLTLNERKSYATCYPLPKPVALSQELQTKPCHSDPTGHEAELHFSSDATVWFKAAIGTCPVAQEQSARLISGRPRSVTARDDQPLDGVVSLHTWLKPRGCRCDSDSSGQYKVGAMEDWSAGVLKPITPLLPYSAVPFRASVNAKQLAQPVFQAGPNRCKSDHGCHFVRVAQSD